jgi:hypothetical protein
MLGIIPRLATSGGAREKVFYEKGSPIKGRVKWKNTSPGEKISFSAWL